MGLGSTAEVGGVSYALYEADCFEWMDLRSANYVQAIVTDPHYGLGVHT